VGDAQAWPHTLPTFLSAVGISLMPGGTPRSPPSAYWNSGGRPSRIPWRSVRRVRHSGEYGVRWPASWCSRLPFDGTSKNREAATATRSPRHRAEKNAHVTPVRSAGNLTEEKNPCRTLKTHQLVSRFFHSLCFAERTSPFSRISHPLQLLAEFLNSGTPSNL